NVTTNRGNSRQAANARQSIPATRAQRAEQVVNIGHLNESNIPSSATPNSRRMI
ncbi:11178_t:CDS:1, partial [Acaulospora colombiana]